METPPQTYSLFSLTSTRASLKLRFNFSLAIYASMMSVIGAFDNLSNLLVYQTALFLLIFWFVLFSRYTSIYFCKFSEMLLRGIKYRCCNEVKLIKNFFGRRRGCKEDVLHFSSMYSLSGYLECLWLDSNFIFFEVNTILAFW